MGQNTKSIKEEERVLLSPAEAGTMNLYVGGVRKREKNEKRLTSTGRVVDDIEGPHVAILLLMSYISHNINTSFSAESPW